MATDTPDTLPAPLPAAAYPAGDAVQRGESALLASEMAKVRDSYVRFMEETYELNRMDAKERAKKSVYSPEEQVRRLEESPPDQVTWYGFNDAMDLDPERGLARWERLKAEARDELESGVRGSGVMQHDRPWDRAQYIALRASFVDEWQPRGGIELSLIDQMAQAYTGWMAWLHHYEVLSNAEIDVQESHYNQTGKVVPLREYRQAIQDRALLTADRFQRIFLRTLRALRDLRRYAPAITILNRGQVNIGDKQVNVKE